VQEGRKFDISEHCIRGLENKLTYSAYEKVKKLRRTILSAIVAEQERQIAHDGIMDARKIAHVAGWLSRDSQRQARERAMVDASEVCSETEASFGDTHSILLAQEKLFGSPNPKKFKLQGLQTQSTSPWPQAA
jgi:hypothetical protein